MLPNKWNGIATLESISAVSYKIKHVTIIWLSHRTPGHLSYRDEHIFSYKNLYIFVYNPLFVTAKIWKQSRYILQWETNWYIHTMEYNSAIKKNKSGMWNKVKQSKCKLNNWNAEMNKANLRMLHTIWFHLCITLLK